MKNIYNRGFTFVELIVVITILAILSTIGFGLFQTYLSDSKDTNRIIQLTQVYDGLERLSVDARLPYPGSMVELVTPVETLYYQGYADDVILKAIGYDGGEKDEELGIYMTYALSNNRRDFQLLSFVNNDQISLGGPREVQALDVDLSSLFPKTIGSRIGIALTQETNIPLHETTLQVDGKYDILSGTGELIYYLSDSEKIFTSNGDDIRGLIPNQSCKRIKEAEGAVSSGKYIINPSGTESIRVYCDMETEGGGWTFLGLIDGSTPTSGISFSGGLGEYNANRTDTGTGYFLDGEPLGHTEMMALIDNKDPDVADKQNKFLMLKYGLDAEMFHTSDLNGCTDEFGKIDGYFYKTYIGEDYIWSNIGNCGSTGWWLRPIVYNPGGLYILRTQNASSSSPYGTEWRPMVWTGDIGDTSQGRGHDVWIYVR